MNEITLLYAVSAIVFCVICLIFAVIVKRGKKHASPLEIGLYCIAIFALLAFVHIYKHGVDIVRANENGTAYTLTYDANDPIAHPPGPNGGEGCNPDCLPDTMEQLKVRLNIQ